MFRSAEFVNLVYLTAGMVVGAAIAVTGLELWGARAERHRREEAARARELLTAISPIDWKKLTGARP
jgi:hypothetical protein